MGPTNDYIVTDSNLHLMCRTVCHRGALEKLDASQGEADLALLCTLVNAGHLYLESP